MAIFKQNDEENPEYIGNMFGWRISIIGAIVILLLGGLIIYRHITMGVPFGMEDPAKTDVPPVDTFSGTNVIDTLRAATQGDSVQ